MRFTSMNTYSYMNNILEIDKKTRHLSSTVYMSKFNAQLSSSGADDTLVLHRSCDVTNAPMQLQSNRHLSCGFVDNSNPHGVRSPRKVWILPNISSCVSLTLLLFCLLSGVKGQGYNSTLQNSGKYIIYYTII